jgi:hypothetical protein
MTNHSISEFSHAPSPHLSTGIFLRRFLFRQPLPLCALRVLCGESSFFFGLSSPSRRIAAKNAKSTDIPPWLSITIINNVDASTPCSRNRNTKNRQFLDPGKVFPSHYRLLAVDCELPSFPKSFVFSHHRYYILNYMNNKIVGAPTYCKRFATGASALCQLPTVNCKLGSQKHAFCRGIIKYVGAPTFLILHANRKSEKPPTSEGGRNKISERFLYLLRYSPPATKSNHSRTSTKFARKSNHSRTYAKTGGWGLSNTNPFAHNSIVFFNYVGTMINYMRNNIVGAPIFPHPHAFAPVFAAYVDAGLQPRQNFLAFPNLELTTDNLKLLHPRQVGMTEVMHLQVLSMDPNSSSDPGNILRTACVSMARGAPVCLLRRGRSERGALC